MAILVSNTSNPENLPRAKSGLDISVPFQGRRFRKETLEIVHNRWWQLGQIIKALALTIFILFIPRKVFQAWKLAYTRTEIKIIEVEEKDNKKSYLSLHPTLDEDIPIPELLRAEEGILDFSTLKFPIEKEMLDHILMENNPFKAIIFSCPDNLPLNNQNIPIPFDDDSIESHLTWIETFRFLLNLSIGSDQDFAIEINNIHVNLFSYLTPMESKDLYFHLNNQNSDEATKILEMMLLESEDDDLKGGIFKRNLNSIFQDMEGKEFYFHLSSIIKSKGYSTNLSHLIKEFPITQIKELIHYCEEKDYEFLLILLKQLQWLADTDDQFKEKMTYLLKKIISLQTNDSNLEYELFKSIRLPKILINNLSLDRLEILIRKIESQSQAVGDGYLLLKSLGDFNLNDKIQRISLFSPWIQNEFLNLLSEDEDISQIRIEICLDQLLKSLKRNKNGFLTLKQIENESLTILKKLKRCEYGKFIEAYLEIISHQEENLVKVLMGSLYMLSINEQKSIISQFMIAVLNQDDLNLLNDAFTAYWALYLDIRYLAEFLIYIGENQFSIVFETALNGNVSDQVLNSLIFGIQDKNLPRKKKAGIAPSSIIEALIPFEDHPRLNAINLDDWNQRLLELSGDS